ncbi:hypothetical protein [Sulfurimonas sp.]|uniref:hypothetical protein n=1 Tax=Sulfurimonas sp. TaxID=2022749 RepID=UPI0025E95CD3|nr:hypothetical protein [Sulfurimonas sp.]
MKPERVDELVKSLENVDVVEFVHSGFYYEIFESTCNDGFAVNVYSSNEKDEYGDYIDKYLIDGGLCTGSVKDAIEFML